MRSEKLKNIRLQSSIHTFNVRSVDEPTIPSHISNSIVKASYNKSGKTWIIRINPNKFEKGDILVYSEFMALTKKLFEEMNIRDCRFWRTDIRLDSYEDNFKDYYKLNLLLISLLSMEINDPNGQAISHMLTCTKEFSDISTKNQYWEIKYYDKKFQTHDTDRTKSRLEFRSLKATQNVDYRPHIVKEKWFEKLNKLIYRYDELQKQCNDLLFTSYQDYCVYNRNMCNSKDVLTKFFSVYSNAMTVFTRDQLRGFFKMCGVASGTVEERIKYICDKTNIEFISKSNLQEYIKIIKESMNDFFSC